MLSGGSQKIETDGVTSSVTLSCDPGYSLKGEPQVVCTDSGTWEITEAPECGKNKITDSGTWFCYYIPNFFSFAIYT